MEYTKKFSGELMSSLNAVTAKKARAFLLEKGYLISAFKLPEYYSVTGLDGIILNPPNWKRRKFPKITKTLDVLTPKNRLSWRSFNFLNPYIYVLTVNEMTSPTNWAKIKSLLTAESLVHSYSTPKLELPAKSNPNKEAILTWLQMAEKDLIKDCVNFHFLTVTDIKDFYPSIYTHSIAWAVHQKVVAKAKRDDYTLLGNRLDRLFQNARDGQTNGVSVGSMVSDLVAEIILKDVDQKLSEKIRQDKLEKQVLIARYRDDYRIMSETEDQGRLVLRHLNRLLSEEYGLYLNADKTDTYNDILSGAFRPWLLDLKKSGLLRKVYAGNLSECNNSRELKDCLLETYFLQKKHPQQRVCVSLLARIAETLERRPSSLKIYEDDIMVIVSLLRKMTLLREEVTPYVFSLFELLIRSLKRQKEKTFLLNAIKKVISGNKDFSYQVIWFYRLCLAVRPALCPKIMIENPDVPLLRVIDRAYYAHDYEIFPSPAVPFDAAVKKELQKFNLIDRAKLAKASGNRIAAAALNPFSRYEN